MGILFSIVLPTILLVLALLLLYVVLTELANFIMTRVPFVPTRHEDIADMVQRVGIQSTDIFYDIGSGNGKVVFAVEKLTAAKVSGLQRGGWTQNYAKLKALLTKSNARFVSGNFFNQPWQEATVIYAYLYPFLMNQVGDKALEDCQPGTKIIVRDFPISNLNLTDSWQTPSKHKMYLYTI